MPCNTAEKQIDEYVQAYFRSNSDALKNRLRFLLELHEDEDRLIYQLYDLTPEEIKIVEGGL